MMLAVIVRFQERENSKNYFVKWRKEKIWLDRNLRCNIENACGCPGPDWREHIRPTDKSGDLPQKGKAEDNTHENMKWGTKYIYIRAHHQWRWSILPSLLLSPSATTATTSYYTRYFNFCFFFLFAVLVSRFTLFLLICCCRCLIVCKWWRSIFNAHTHTLLKRIPTWCNPSRANNSKEYYIYCMCMCASVKNGVFWSNPPHL